MRAGRKPKPTQLRIIEGNPGHRPLQKNEPKPTPVAPTRPDWLDPEAKREWGRIVPELERLGLLTLVDRGALAAYCQAWGRAVQAEKVLAGGLTFTTPNGYVQQRPEVAIAQKSWQLVRAFAAEFGLTPSARSRLSVQKPEDEAEDDLD
jgi:P27 family predicted phage terminase small subunit